MKGTKTEANLVKAFAGESQARNRYLFFAKIAKKEGYEQIGEIFEKIADHELSHAKNFFKFLKETEPVQITASFQGGRLGTTLENLQLSMKGELDEGHNLYPEYSQVAKEEGYPKVASLFKMIAKVEKEHHLQFKAIYDRLESGKWFEREESVQWICRKCGYVHEGTRPPEICPACFHPTGYFETYVRGF